MHAVGVDGQGDVHAVVDEERDVGLGEDGAEAESEVDELARGGVLFAELDHGDAAGDGFLDDPFEGAAEAEGAVGDEVEAEG
jgi:hypothetical protein